MRLFLLEDDQETAEYILNGFREEGHVIDHATNGEDALMITIGTKFDVLILDRMVPDPDGLKLLSMLRAGGDHTPAIFLTAVGTIDDRVKGLDLADDYLVKPFAFAELRARVQALMRRPPTPTDTQKSLLAAADLELDLRRRSVKRAGVNIPVQPTEFRLLEYLVRNKGRIVTRTMLLENVWDFNFDPKTNIVETHISRLRSKMDHGFDRQLIRTVRGAGYIVDEDT